MGRFEVAIPPEKLEINRNKYGKPYFGIGRYVRFQ